MTSSPSPSSRTPPSSARISATNSRSFTWRPSRAPHEKPYAPISVAPAWSKDSTPRSVSIRSRVAGIEAPASPAWIETRSEDVTRSIPSWRAVSASRKA